MTKHRITKVELIVTAYAIFFCTLTVYSTSQLERENYNRIFCGTNLKGLGTAQHVYANDYEDQFARQGSTGKTTWGEKTENWDDPDRSWDGDQEITVGASLYLLVREEHAELSDFVCPSGNQTEFTGNNPNSFYYTDLYDFGAIDYQNTGPRNCVSYSYQIPYSKHAATGAASASFAFMADKSPWYDRNIKKGDPSDYEWKDKVDLIVWDDLIRGDRDWQLQVGNSFTHLRQGQNVIYGDGHSSYEVRPDIGVRHDNLYTIYKDAYGTTENDRRTGKSSDPYGIGYGQPARDNDSFLVNDDEIYPCYQPQTGDLNDDCTVDMQDMAIISQHWMESTKQ